MLNVRLAPARGGPTVLGRGSVGIAPDGRRRGAALGLLSVAVIGGEDPVWAQDAESTGVGISLDDLSSYPTHLTVDGFMVELTKLTATEEYQVTVSSDSARVGIGGCGTATQTATVTGVEEREIRFVVYACAVGGATVTAEVRRAGASSPEASVSQTLTVEALPEIVIGPTGERIRTTTTRGTRQAVPKAGTPGIVPNIEFFDRTATSVRVRWGQPSDGGGTGLTGFGLKFWKEGTREPGYEPEDVDLVGPPPTPSEYTKTGMERGARYNFRIHACSGEDNCGYWTNPPKTVDIPLPEDPGPVTNLQHTRNNGSVTLTWTAPGKSGSGKLTGYHVQHRQSGGTWPVGAAVVTPATNTTWTGNLSSGTAHDVRVQACNGDSLCGDWVERAIPGTTMEPIVDAPPGTVEHLRLKGFGNGTLYVEWNAPDDPGSAAVTRYKLQYKQQTSAVWMSVPDVLAPTTEGRVSGLTNGTNYDVQVQACNGSTPDPCGDWVRPVCGVPGTTTKPGQAGIPTLTSSHETLTVSWDPPTCVSAITHYEVQATTAPSDVTVDPTWPSAGVDVGKVTETDLDGLVNGTPYLVRVRACNTARTTTDKCGDWSEAKQGTPSSDRLGTPRGLDVVPLPERKALLQWDVVTEATAYVVQVRAHGQTTWDVPDRSDPRSGDVRPPTPGSPPPTEYEIDLDAIITISGSAKVGLADARAYEFQIKATASGIATSHYSQTIIIIDTPITSANGHSPGTGVTSGKAAVEWKDLGDSFTDDIFDGGTYKLRHRRSSHDSKSIDWTPGEYDRNETTNKTSSLSLTIAKLTRYRIYAVQLLYEKDAHRVFAARDVYVWPSEKAVASEDEGERIATFPVYGYPLTTKSADGRSMEFEYYICADTFPSSSPKSDWVPFINHAMLQWQYASDELVKMIHKGNSCIDYRPFLNDLIKEVRAIVKGGQVDGKTKMEIEDDIEAHWLTLIARYRTKGINGTKKIGELSDPDAEKSEIMMIRDADWSDEAHVVFAFLTFGGQIGLGGCEGGCAHAQRTRDGSTTSTDIFLRESYHVTDGNGILQAVIRPGAADDIEFNTCPHFDGNYHLPYSSIVHEAGHAIGLGHPDKAQVKTAIMSYYNPPPPQCAPHPLDVMAIYALYQSKVNR